LATLRERRQAIGLTQDELARELQVSIRTIKRLEKQPALDRLYELAIEALTVRLSQQSE